MKKLTTLIFTLFAFLTGPLMSASEHVQASLVSEVDSIEPGKAFWVGLNLKMEPGWHTYWKQAGDTGLATSIDWKLPGGFSASEIHWPVPEKHVVQDLTSFSYGDEVLLLVKITPPDHLDLGEPVKLLAEARWLACKESCIPEEAQLELSLPVNKGVANFNTQWHTVFEVARKKLPLAYNSGALQNLKIGAYIHKGMYGLLIEGDNLPKSVQFYSYNDDIQFNGVQNLEKAAQGYFLTLPLAKDVDIPEKLEGILVTSQSWSSNEVFSALAIDIQGHKEEAIALSNEMMPAFSWVNALMFAFIGGIILNLMPCVFPVLGLKVMSFVKYAGESAWKARMHGIIFTIGVLVSFWALVGTLFAFKAGGMHLGWGFQFQSPFFVTFLCFFLLLLSLNFLGTFEMGLSLMSAGNKLNNSSGYTGTFLSGVLATVLATPCTAPFMGTAIGFALTQPAFVAFSVFTALALGMSLPYLVLTFLPHLLKYLPKPGAWMETFKQAMAFPLLATVVWLLWVFGQQTHHDALTGLLFGLLLAGTAAWIYGRFANFSASVRRRSIGRLASMLILAMGIGLGYVSATKDPEFPQSNAALAANKVHQTGDLAWEKFTPERLQELQAEGRAVFIDFTAAWCLTCQTNKKNVFSSEKVIAKLKEKDVVLLHADYTKKDPAITLALQGYGRSGVPTNVFYSGDKKGEPVVLPEMLTPGTVLEVLE